MKIRVFVFGVVLFASALALAGEVDFMKCQVCKPMMQEPGLMQHMRWDNQKLASGMIMVNTIDRDYVEAFDRAHEKMLKNLAKLEGGEELDMCPICYRMTGLAAEGASIENVSSGDTRITIVTAQNKKTVGKIHEHHDWMQKQFGGAKQEHEGHDHGEHGHGHSD